MSVSGRANSTESLAAADTLLSGSSGKLWPVHNILVAALLLLMLLRVLPDALGEENFGIQVDASGVTIRDFAAHLTFAKAFWSEHAGYSVRRHVEITDRWAGQSVGRALPFGYSPTMLWLLAPLCGLPTVWGYVAWTALSGGAVWWMSRAKRTVSVVGPLVLLGPLGLVCFALGQTAFMSAAAIMYLMLRSAQKRSGPVAWPGAAADAIVLWALTAKPPLAIVAGAALLAERRWKTLALAVGMTVVSTVLLTPALGFEWPREYLHLVTNYDRQTADAAFAWSLRPDHMTNIRSLVWHTGWLGDTAACRLSTVIWLLTTGAITVAGLRRKLGGERLWALAVISFLLFCPHVTSTEDLHLVLLMPLVAVTGALGQRRWQLVLLLCLVVAFLPPSVAWLPLAVRSSVLLAVKLVLAGLLLIDCRRPF